MTINTYQQLALRTEHVLSDEDVYTRILQGLMGLCGESGECMDILKKHIYQGHEFDKHHLALELGDVAWYLAIAANAIGYSLNDICWMNIMKLKDRYPDGFDAELSINREEGDI